MYMAGGIFCADGLFGVLEFASVPSLAGCSFDIGHDDEDDDVIRNDDAVALRLARFYF